MLGFSPLASAPLADDGAIAEVVYLLNGDGIVTGQVVIGSPTIVQDQALSGDDIATGDFNVVAEIGTDGNITLREIQDSAQNTIANVHQIDGADIRISGWFKV
jgi:hypothetical protein